MSDTKDDIILNSKIPSSGERMKVLVVRGAIVLTVLLGAVKYYYSHYYPIAYQKVYPNGKLFEKSTLINGLKSGPATVYYESGAVLSEDNFKNGRLDGVIKRYYEDGKYSSVNTFKADKMDGLNEFYYPTGEKRSSEMYKDNVQHGASTLYYKSGQIEEESEFINGKMSGKHTRYFDNGQLEEIVYFKDGLKNGPQKVFTKEGLWKANLSYVNGKLSGLNERYSEDGTIRAVANYSDGVQQGVAQYFNESGALDTSTEYQDDKRHGVHKIYYASQPEKTTVDVNSEPHYRPDEKIPVRWMQTYATGRLDGPIKLFNKDGVVVAELTYAPNLIFNAGKINFAEAFGKNKMDSSEEELLFDGLVALLLVNEDFDQLEELAAKFRQEKSRLSSGVMKLDELYQAMREGFGDITSKEEFPYLDLLNRWIEKYPQSSTPRALLVEAYTDIAWKHNDGGFANALTENGAKEFNDFLHKAYRAGQSAMQFPIQDPELYRAMIDVGMGLSLPKEDLNVFLEAGRAIDPGYDALYTAMAAPLLPFSMGRGKELEEYAERTHKQTQEQMGSRMYAILYSAVKAYAGIDFAHEYKYDWKKLKAGFEELLKDYPESRYYLNQYVFFASEAGEKETALKLFEKIGDRWDLFSEKVWLKKVFFDERRQWALGKGTLKPGNILQVANAHDLDLVREIIGVTGNLNVQDSAGRTSLMTAIINDNFPVATLLVEQGADLSVQDNDGKEAIHYAATTFSDELLKVLITKGAAANPPDRWGYSPLHYAARDGFVKQVELLLADKDVDINSKADSGDTALHLAVHQGHVEVVEELLNKSLVEVSGVNKEGKTPLHLAAIGGFTRIVEDLLAHSADKNIKDNEGMTAEDYAQENGHEELYKILEPDPPPVVAPAKK